MKKLLLLALLGIFFMLTAGIGCRGGSTAAKKAANEEITLTVWSVFDTKKDLQGIFDGFSKQFPNIKFSIQTFNFQEYETELLDALAEDRGPDIYALPNTWVRKYENKIEPMPPKITVPVKVVKGSVKKETVVELQEIPMLSPKSLQTQFVDVVYDDVVFDTSIEVDGKKQTVTKIFGLPLSVDTLALYYNVDLLNAAGISVPATDWTTFSEHVKKLTKFDADGNIIQAGAAVGTGKNIERSSDIISLLMMQNGTEMTDTSGTNITFDKVPANSERTSSYGPGEEALIFYTDFANKSNANYTYNADLPNSLQAFVSGQTAYFFGYAYHRPIILNQGRGLNFQVAEAPIINGNPNIHYANYWTYTVSKKSPNTDWSWNFLKFATTAANVEPYLESLKKPTGLRELVDKQKKDFDMRAWANMVLTAQSWYKGRDSKTMERILQEMIDSVVEGRAFAADAVKQASGMVQQTMR
ncbi:MAG TPA: extracellular solute-binding protein [Patescibacteria group bacterium]|nr:extracellular solute-binding protein [Patescibacteria group bacterium]